MLKVFRCLLALIDVDFEGCLADDDNVGVEELTGTDVSTTPATPSWEACSVCYSWACGPAFFASHQRRAWCWSWVPRVCVIDSKTQSVRLLCMHNFTNHDRGLGGWELDSWSRESCTPGRSSSAYRRNNPKALHDEVKWFSCWIWALEMEEEEVSVEGGGRMAGGWGSTSWNLWGSCRFVLWVHGLHSIKERWTSSSTSFVDGVSSIPSSCWYTICN